MESTKKYSKPEEPNKRPVIVSVSSMASTSSQTGSQQKYVCPLPAQTCPDQREKDRVALINHLTQGHYGERINSLIATLQAKFG